MKALSAVIIVALCLSFQTGRADQCEEPYTTKDMVACLKTKLSYQEDYLEKLRQEIRLVLKPDEKLFFEQAKLSWESFQFADCNSARYLFSGGTASSIVFLECKVDATSARINTLKQIYKNN